MPKAAQEAIWAAFDGKDAGDPRPFFAQLTAAASEIGFPVFLRTDHPRAPAQAAGLFNK